MPTRQLADGALLVFPLPNGMFGACRVLRGPDADETQFGKSVLVCATPWIGDAKDALGAKAAKKVSRETYWCEGAPPASFQLAGVIALTGARAKNRHVAAPWAMFPNVVYAAWLKEHEPAALVRAADASTAREAAKLERLQATLRVDLSGVVPLATPKSERSPEDVLRGFLAAMARWERECTRIEKQAKAHVFDVVAAALQTIFAEFCTTTPTPRPTQSFSSPPAHADEHIVATTSATARKVVLGTEQGPPFRTRRVYTLVKRDGVWLIDRRKPAF
jgi:hypothetical protein